MLVTNLFQKKTQDVNEFYAASRLPGRSEFFPIRNPVSPFYTT